MWSTRTMNWHFTSKQKTICATVFCRVVVFVTWTALLGRIPSFFVRRCEANTFSTAMAIEVFADVALLSDVAFILCSIKIDICHMASNAVPVPKELQQIQKWTRFFPRGVGNLTLQAFGINAVFDFWWCDNGRTLEIGGSRFSWWLRWVLLQLPYIHHGVGVDMHSITYGIFTSKHSRWPDQMWDWTNRVPTLQAQKNGGIPWDLYHVYYGHQPLHGTTVGIDLSFIPRIVGIHEDYVYLLFNGALYRWR